MSSFLEEYGKMIVVIIVLAGLLILAGYFVFRSNAHGTSMYEDFVESVGLKRHNAEGDDGSDLGKGWISMSQGEWEDDNTCLVTATEMYSGTSKAIKVRGAELYTIAYNAGMNAAEAVTLSFSEGPWSSDYKKNITVETSSHVTDTYTVDGSDLINTLNENLDLSVLIDNPSWNGTDITVNSTASTNTGATASASKVIDGTPIYNTGFADGKGDVTVNQIITPSDWHNKKMTVTSVASLSNGTSNIETLEVDASSVYNEGHTAGKEEGSDEVTVISTLEQGEWNTANKQLIVTGIAKASNGKTDTSTTIVDASNIFNAGWASGADTVTVTASLEKDNWEGKRMKVKAIALGSNGASHTFEDYIDASDFYSEATEIGVNSVDVTASIETGEWDALKQMEILAVATGSNGKQDTVSKIIDASDIYTDGVAEGRGNVTVEASLEKGAWSNNKIKVKAIAKGSNGESHSFEEYIDAVSVYNSGYNVGKSDGSAAVTVAETLTQGSWSGNKLVVTGKATGSNGKTASATTTVDATSIYNSGFNAGKISVPSGANGTLTITGTTSIYAYNPTPTLRSYDSFTITVKIVNGAVSSKSLSGGAPASRDGYTYVETTISTVTWTPS